MRDRQRTDFAERIRRQVASRYLDVEIRVDREAFAMLLKAPGIDVSLPLTPLFHECSRNEAETPRLISAFVRDVESRLNGTGGADFSLAGLIWCVRTNSYLAGSARAELVTKPIAGDLTAFVARPIPVKAMRGVGRDEWEAAGLSEDAVIAAADSNTAERFSSLLTRINEIDRVPGDGWRISVDELFCSSAILVPEIRRALVEKAQDDVLVAIPDRSVVLVLPASAQSAPRFQFRATREWREAMNPCSREVFRCDGVELVLEPGKPKTRALLDWLPG